LDFEDIGFIQLARLVYGFCSSASDLPAASFDSTTADTLAVRLTIPLSG
jgi:hypothetical protein